MTLCRIDDSIDGLNDASEGGISADRHIRWSEIVIDRSENRLLLVDPDVTKHMYSAEDTKKNNTKVSKINRLTPQCQRRRVGRISVLSPHSLYPYQSIHPSTSPIPNEATATIISNSKRDHLPFRPVMSTMFDNGLYPRFWPRDWSG